MFLTALGLFAILRSPKSQSMEPLEADISQDQCSKEFTLEDAYLTSLDLKNSINVEIRRSEINCFCHQEFLKNETLLKELDVNDYIKQVTTVLSETESLEYLDLQLLRQERENKEAKQYFEVTENSHQRHPFEDGIPYDAVWDEISQEFEKRVNQSSGVLVYERSGKPWNEEFLEARDEEIVPNYC